MVLENGALRPTSSWIEALLCALWPLNFPANTFATEAPDKVMPYKSIYASLPCVAPAKLDRYEEAHM